jgi:glycosyltransferase involved in cell wall biosynthesis
MRLIPPLATQRVTQPPSLVSIVLPTYKRASVLPHAIRSVLAQTYVDWELIVVDDNSPDETPEVVAGFTDPRIRYVRNEPNLKLPRALNRGFSLARGEYLTWTSDDNLFGEQAIEKMVLRLREGACEFVYADYFLYADIDASGQPLAQRHQQLPSQLQLDKQNHIGACFMYTRRAYELVGDYEPDLFLVEDYDYFIRLARAVKTCHLPEPLYYFRRHDDSLFCARYCEVKAADVLVRFKNGLIDDGQARQAVVGLLLENVDGVRSQWLRWTGALARRASYRLGMAHQALCERHFAARTGAAVSSLLDRYRNGSLDFNEAKRELMALMQRVGTVEYVRPAFLGAEPGGRA